MIYKHNAAKLIDKWGVYWVASHPAFETDWIHEKVKNFNEDELIPSGKHISDTCMGFSGLCQDMAMIHGKLASVSGWFFFGIWGFGAYLKSQGASGDSRDIVGALMILCLFLYLGFKFMQRHWNESAEIYNYYIEVFVTCLKKYHGVDLRG